MRAARDSALQLTIWPRVENFSYGQIFFSHAPLPQRLCNNLKPHAARSLNSALSISQEALVNFAFVIQRSFPNPPGLAQDFETASMQTLRIPQTGASGSTTGGTSVGSTSGGGLNVGTAMRLMRFTVNPLTKSITMQILR
jgi:hypothetical protein